MTDPRNVINRILDADDLSRGEIFASLTVRSDLRPLFESARELTGSPEGRLFQGTYQYVEDQGAEVVLRLIPVELLGDVNPGTYRDVVVQITD
jgi:hypothetical protein